MGSVLARDLLRTPPWERTLGSDTVMFVSTGNTASVDVSAATTVPTFSVGSVTKV